MEILCIIICAFLWVSSITYGVWTAFSSRSNKDTVELLAKVRRKR